MPGEIKHYWVGTTLMVESDAGVSGCDLKGQTGDIGPRGPQGPAGVVVDGGNIDIDLTGYATEAYVDNAIANAQLGGGDVDLSNYATKTYVDTAVNAGRQDLTNYATKDDLTGLATEDYVDNAVANVDLTDYAKKVYVEAAIDNRILFGTSDKTPGVSALSHGRFYFVYE